MNHKDILTQSSAALRTRSELYGSEEDVLSRACVIFEAITGVEMSMYEGAIFMHSYEMARIKKNRRNMSTVLTSIEYLALSGQLAVTENDLMLEDSMCDVKEMASKLSPVLRQPSPTAPQEKVEDKKSDDKKVDDK